MKVTRTEQIYIRDNETISMMCHISKNLFNQTNYILKQQFLKQEKLSSYNDLVKLFQKPSENNENNNYQKLPAQTAQWTIKKVKQSWYSFFKARRAWKKHPEKFTGMPKPPKYKEKNGEFMLIFTNQQCSIHDGFLKFPKIMNLEVKTRLENVNLREVRIIPLGNSYSIEIVYKKDVRSPLGRNTNIMGIDIGVDNIVAISNNAGLRPIVVKGGVVKSINQFYNKQMAKLRSINDVQNKRNREHPRYTESMRLSTGKRNREIKDLFHKLSIGIARYALQNNMDTIVIGHNKLWKQDVNIGDRNNQNFVQIPFNMLISMVKYKAEEYGIEVILQKESYTSKCSFLDNEAMEKHEAYLGKRIKRGLFRTAKGFLINADINGSFNIIKKAFPNAFSNGIEGLRVNPESLSIFKLLKMTTSKEVC